MCTTRAALRRPRYHASIATIRTATVAPEICSGRAIRAASTLLLLCEARRDGLDAYESPTSLCGAERISVQYAGGRSQQHVYRCHHSIFNNTDVDTTHVKHPCLNSEAGSQKHDFTGDATGSTVSSTGWPGPGPVSWNIACAFCSKGALDFATATRCRRPMECSACRAIRRMEATSRSAWSLVPIPAVRDAISVTTKRRSRHHCG